MVAPVATNRTTASSESLSSGHREETAELPGMRRTPRSRRLRERIHPVAQSLIDVLHAHLLRRLEAGAFARGYFHEPTIFTGVEPGMRIAREEIFGPVVSVMRCRSLEEAVEIGNGVEYGLSASIYTQDINRAFSAMRDLYTGIFYVNAPTIGAEVHLPFGGTKNTGNGHREAGVAALDVFSEWKSIYIDFSGKLQRAQIDVENH